MIYCVIGTRAQLVKMAPVIKGIENNNWSMMLIHTGQHSVSMQEISNNFSIKTTWKDIVHQSEINTSLKALYWLIKVCWEIIMHPHSIVNKKTRINDIVLVHGDTFSTILGALLAKRLGIKVAHVESGLRSHNLFNPFPEEINRLITFRLSDIAFCPSEWACQNLQKYTNLVKINTFGNTLYDSLHLALKKNRDLPELEHVCMNNKYAIASLHRFENIYFKKRLDNIISMLKIAADKTKLLFILHPATKNRLIRTGLMSKLKHPNIKLMDRVDYFEFIRLIKSCSFVITDGGSNQEELYYLGIPTLLMRKITERQEGIGDNTCISNYNIENFIRFLNNISEYASTPVALKDSPTNVILRKLKEYAND